MSESKNKSCRPQFFQRQVVSAADLNAGQDYFRQRMRLQNRLLHGCGVVRGLHVVFSNTGREESGHPVVNISPGLAIGPGGDEIVVPEGLALAIGCWSGGDENCERLDDVAESPEQTAWLAIRYTEAEAVPKAPVASNCSGSRGSQISRICEGFEVKLFTERPPGCHKIDCDQAGQQIDLRHPPEVLPEDDPFAEPDGQWVILATVEKSLINHNHIVDYRHRQTIPSVQVLAERVRCGTEAEPVRQPTIQRIIPNQVMAKNIAEVAAFGDIDTEIVILGSALSDIADITFVPTSFDGEIETSWLDAEITEFYKGAIVVKIQSEGISIQSYRIILHSETFGDISTDDEAAILQVKYPDQLF